MKNFKCLILGLLLVLSGLLLIACGADKTDDSTDYLRGAVSRADLTFPLGMEISSDTEFAYIAFNTNPELTGLEWFDRISDAEYAALPNAEKGLAKTEAGQVQGYSGGLWPDCAASRSQPAGNGGGLPEFEHLDVGT